MENEAELSGSEPESGDEDERGLDRLEIEEGDLDDLDDEEVRDEVGKIHQRRLLVEDQREVRLFQEAFLEDGELHSDQTRQRQFKWRNIGRKNNLIILSLWLKILFLQMKVKSWRDVPVMMRKIMIRLKKKKRDD